MEETSGMNDERTQRRNKIKKRMNNIKSVGTSLSAIKRMKENKAQV